MRQTSLFDNAIGWGHFKLRGGRRNLLTTTIAFAAAVVGLIMLSLRIDPQSTLEVLGFWTMGLMGLQLGLLILFGSSAVRNAVRRDITTGMLESHRLMPVTGTQAVVGYILGGSSQAVALGLANMVIGMVLSAVAGVSILDWILANVITAVFAVCAWTAVTLFSFETAAAFGLLIIFLVICFTSGGIILAALPGITVISGPMIGKSVFGILKSGASWGLGYQISFGAQFMLALLCFVGAARRYQRDDVLPFTPPMGLGLLAIWVGLSAIGINYWPEFECTLMAPSHMPRDTQLIGSMLATMLVAVVPVSATAWMQTNYHRRRLLDDPAVGRRPAAVNLVIVAACLIALVLPMTVALDMVTAGRLARSGLSIAAFLLAVGYLLRILYRTTIKAVTLTTVYILIVGIGPLFVDGVRCAALGLDEDEFFSVVSGCSPIGTMLYLWQPRNPWQSAPIGTTPGLVVQFIPVAILALLFHATQARRLPPTAQPASVQLRAPNA